jgi:hypothetical protein
MGMVISLWLCLLKHAGKFSNMRMEGCGGRQPGAALCWMTELVGSLPGLAALNRGYLRPAP